MSDLSSLKLETPSSPPPASSSSSLQTPGSSRPETPSSARPTPHTFQHTFNPQHVRRQSSGSLSSRRTSLLTPPLPVDTSSPGPQRLPRQPSSDFAELHNELEIEQEAAVNRLLNMIRLQQIQNQHAQGTDDGNSSTGATFDSASTTTRARSPGISSSSALRTSLSRQSSFNYHRPASRSSSTHATSSPSLLPAANTSIPIEEGQWLLGGSRDEAGFYMAETQMLTRENEMLKKRIRELEKQVSELKKPEAKTATSTTASSADSPAASDKAALAELDKITPTNTTETPKEEQ
ncbi:hypothetical protein DFH27DRAFT_487638 [Peziza echinospora]|nr:hypothetical protein DFH27DRAFT_487638 [Peziza echinospora]